jgi:hypothetical protein
LLSSSSSSSPMYTQRNKCSTKAGNAMQIIGAKTSWTPEHNLEEPSTHRQLSLTLHSMAKCWHVTVDNKKCKFIWIYLVP